MQMPAWARGAKSPAGPTVKKKDSKPAGPTIRDEAWWVEKMKWWRKDEPERPFPVGKVGLWLALPAENAPTDLLDQLVRTNADLVLERIATGESVGEVATSLTELFGVLVSEPLLRLRLTDTMEARQKYNLARAHFANRLVDEAVKDIHTARRMGDVKWAGEFSLKVAGKIDPGAWGDKSQLTVGGIAGQPIETKTIEQTPAEAMRAALGHKE